MKTKIEISTEKDIINAAIFWPFKGNTYHFFDVYELGTGESEIIASLLDAKKEIEEEDE